MDALSSHVTQTVHDGILLDGLVGKPDRNNNDVKIVWLYEAIYYVM